MVSDNENSVPSNESDEDIYKDISDFNFENVLAKLEGSNEVHKQEASDLAEKVKELTEKNEELRKLNDTLGKNLSTLLKTAQNEIKRKDSMIEKLRLQVDSCTVRENTVKTKNKSTSTEDLNYGFDYKNINKECKNDRENCTNVSKSFDEKTSKFSENNFRNQKKIHDDVTDEKTCCDSGSNSYRNSLSRDQRKDRGHRDSRRDGKKYDYFDKERFSSRLQDNHKWPQSRSFRAGRDHHRKRSPRRKRHSERFRNFSRSLSRSPQRSRHSRESSFERHRISKSPYKKNQQSKSRSNSSNKVSDSESHKKFFKSTEDKNEKEKSKEKTEKKSQVKEKISFGISESKNNVDFQGQLNTFSDAVRTEVTSNRYSSAETENSKPVLGIEEKMEEAEEQQNYVKSDIQEDWTLSFKNERQSNTNPMTIYSWRMMQKLKADTETGAGNTLRNSSTNKETFENFEKVATKEEKLTINSETVESEKEPGELTEDENEVESSKEFQKLTKIASATCLSVVQNQEGSKTKDNLFKEDIDKKKSGDKKRVELTSVKVNKCDEETSKDKNKNFPKHLDSPGERGGLVEFSPFKNNYKLIEISPVKPVETSKTKRLPTNPYAQNSVESSTFKLLSALSGIPLYKESKPKTEPGDQEPSNKKSNSSNVTSKESIKSSKKINEVNQPEGKSVTNENSSNSKILKNRSKEPKVQENKIKNSPPKKIEKETQKEPNKPGISNDSGTGKTKSNSTDKNDQSPNLIQGTMTSVETETDKKSVESRDLHNNTEKKDFASDANKVSKDKSPKFSPPKKSVSKVKDSSSKDEKITSESKEHSADKQRQKTKEVPKSCGTESVPPKKKTEIVSKSPKSENLKAQPSSKTGKNKKDSPENAKGKPTSKHESKKETKEGKSCKRKRKLNEEQQKAEEINENQDEPIVKRLRSHKDAKNDSSSSEKGTIKEDISFFEFFKPIEKSSKANKTETEELSTSADFKVTTTMSVTNVVCLETPSKGVEKFKNFMINEQTIYQVLDAKSNFSPRIGPNCVEMTPRRLLKNDLMLTDSEDDSVVKSTQKRKPQEEDAKEKSKDENEEDEDDDDDEMSESDYCEWESDSGASDLVDLL